MYRRSQLESIADRCEPFSIDIESGDGAGLFVCCEHMHEARTQFQTRRTIYNLFKVARASQTQGPARPHLMQQQLHKACLLLMLSSPSGWNVVMVTSCVWTTRLRVRFLVLAPLKPLWCNGQAYMSSKHGILVRFQVEVLFFTRLQAFF